MNIIQAVVAIGLLAMTVGAGVSYVRSDMQSSGENASVIAAGFQTLLQADQSRQMTGAPPPDPATWSGVLFPTYGFEPKAPQGTTWSYGAGAGGRWFCLAAPKASPALRSALTSLGKQYSSVSYGVTAHCGDQPPPAATAAPPAGGDVAATLWITREGS